MARLLTFAFALNQDPFKPGASPAFHLLYVNRTRKRPHLCLWDKIEFFGSDRSLQNDSFNISPYLRGRNGGRAKHCARRRRNRCRYPTLCPGLFMVEIIGALLRTKLPTLMQLRLLCNFPRIHELALLLTALGGKSAMSLHGRDRTRCLHAGGRGSRSRPCRGAWPRTWRGRPR
jgi:hypothetical protein